ncbi:NADH oxidase [Spiroplasma gladiatoris]|uniref:NADH oxidase n=1 Tax=Spiroplasma gladiatoris TaxID=2143 RepID=A0A4P7AKH3_9MOLU|nr:CoA-disulfide reductase [Spiroplasma gladiatoris]QBQ08156.1 NADH oxidase [Spiroplasma gladiatoris]
MKIVILGGGATGMGVAAKLKRNDKNNEVIVIETENYVSLGACGLPYFVGNHFENKNNLFARSIEKFNESGIEVKINQKFLNADFDNKKIDLEDQTISYDKLVIATGSTNSVPNISGLDDIKWHKLTKLEDALELKEKCKDTDVKNILIVGAGFIGLELAENLSKLGKSITIVERDEELFSRLYDEEISQLLEQNLQRNKIELILNSSVSEFKKSNNNKVLANINQTEFEYDLVVLASGFKPNTKFFKDSKLKMDNKGAIIVDEFGATNIVDVYSGGDCCVIKNKITNELCYSPLATVASKQAKVIANNICNINSKFSGTIQSSIIRVFDDSAARAGITEKEAISMTMKIKTVFIKDKDHTNYLKGQKDIYLKLIMNEDTKELVGAQMLGDPNSILRFYCLVPLIWNKNKVDESLEQIDLPYAPPFSRTFDIIHIALSKLV